MEQSTNDIVDRCCDNRGISDELRRKVAIVGASALIIGGAIVSGYQSMTAPERPERCDPVITDCN